MTLGNKIDIVFVNTNSSKKVYQDLATNYSAIEPPFWSLMLAESCRQKGYSVAIIDAIAENLTHEQTATRVIDLNPKYCCFVTYGSNPNSSTTFMTGVYEVAQYIFEGRKEYIEIISIGNHTAALPPEVLNNPNIDFVCINEGVYAILNLLSGKNPKLIPGLGWKENNQQHLNNGLGSIVPQDRLDIDLPGYAWDLLPYKERPFDLYRAHNWHAEYNDEYRTPFASLYTSLGCKFKCNFCMINIINRENITEGVSAAESNNMRFWSPEHIIKIFDELVVKYGVTTIRILDEMFFLNKKYYEPLLTMLRDRGYGKDLRMWTYARVDTVNERFLELFKAGGVKWLALGIEAANQTIRKEIYKGKFQDINIRDVVKQIKDHGMYAGCNYIFGHPEEKMEHMQETLDLALELNGEFSNFYTAMALPGSPLYYEAKNNGWELPSTPEGWSFHSYECQPLPTKYLKPEEVLAFRDKAWHTYFESPSFQNLVKEKFGDKALNHIQEQTKIKLKRKILGD